MSSGDRLHIEEPWRRPLAGAGLDTPEAWWTDARIQIWRDIRERQNGLLTLGDGRFHVKRLRPPHGLEVNREVEGIRLLEAAGIDTVPLVAWGQSGDGRGLLVTSDLAGFRPADRRLAEGEPFARISSATAAVAGRLHRAGLHHRDLYLCHFLLNDAGDVRLIDAARVRRLPWLRRRRWIVKDLAQFRYSARQAGASEAELDAWLADWCGDGWDARRMRPGVVRKAAWIARHDARLAQSQPERYATLRARE